MHDTPNPSATTSDCKRKLYFMNKKGQQRHTLTLPPSSEIKPAPDVLLPELLPIKSLPLLDDSANTATPARSPHLGRSARWERQSLFESHRQRRWFT